MSKLVICPRESKYERVPCYSDPVRYIQRCIVGFLTPLKKGDDTQIITITDLLTKCKAKKQTGEHQAAHVSLRETWDARKQAVVRRVNSRDLQSVQAERGRAGITAGPMSACKSAERSILSKQIFVTWNKRLFAARREEWSSWNARKKTFSQFLICFSLSFTLSKKRIAQKKVHF